MNKNRERVIFFVVSSSAVFRNLFFFPSSVFDRLKERLATEENFRIVFMMPKEFQKKFPEFIAECSKHNSFNIEFIAISGRKNFLQKIFYFFYSYLIYTGTTWIMATIGTRPDEPPAGGKKYLAPFKSLIAHTFGKIKFIKKHLIPSLHHIIFYERPFKNAFNKFRPDLIFVPHLYGWYDALVLSEAKRRNIKTLGMAAGWDHLDKYFLPFHVDRLLAQSAQIKNAAMNFQAYSPDQIELVGYPHFDFIEDDRYRVDRAQILGSLNFPKDSKYILYVSGSAYCPDEPEIIETILRWADENKFGCDLCLVIRPYSGGRSQDKDFDLKKFERFEAHPRVRFYKREFWGDLEKSIYFVNIMRHADIVLAVYTTMALEAAVLDRPLIATAFDGNNVRPLERSIRRFEQFEHFKDVLRLEAMKTTRNFDELYMAINDYLKNPNLDGDKREVMRQELCYKLDGKASERIAQHILNEANVE